MALLGALLLALALLCSWGLARRRDPGSSPGTGRGRPRSLPALPLVGSLLQLAGHPQLHLRLCRLQGRYGSLYALWMGSHYVVVVNSYRHAREVLLRKGKDFAGRPRTVSGQRVCFGDPFPRWRGARRGTQQGPCPLPILRPKGARFSRGWLHPWASLRMAALPGSLHALGSLGILEPPTFASGPNLFISPWQGESKAHVLCFACLH